jgi:hypothetical protein
MKGLGGRVFGVTEDEIPLLEGDDMAGGMVGGWDRGEDGGCDKGVDGKGRMPGWDERVNEGARGVSGDKGGEGKDKDERMAKVCPAPRRTRKIDGCMSWEGVPESKGRKNETRGEGRG